MQTLKELYNNRCGSEEWSNKPSDYVCFVDDKDKHWAFPIFRIDSMCVNGTEMMVMFGGIWVSISGPKVMLLLEDFLKKNVTRVKAGGSDITSVNVVLPNKDSDR